jgi:hypothetical protein
VTLSGYAEWPKVADAVIEAPSHSKNVRSIVLYTSAEIIDCISP